METATQIVMANAFIFSLFIVWLSWIIILPIVAWITKAKKTWGNFWEIYLITAVITGIILMFISSSPNQISNLMEWGKTFLKL